jgi:hypothetical protein
LREPQDLPQEGGVPIRTGNPDGGVEWYINRTDGSQWGWQAKYIYNVDTLLTAMGKTIDRVLLERPNLTRLAFCIPFNLSAGSSGGRRKSARTRFEDALSNWQRTKPKAASIDLVLIDESELIARLALPKHAGRRMFWFNQLVFSPETLRRKYEEASEYAGDRYRPELQVDLPIQFDLEALGFADSYFNQFNEHRIAFVRDIRWLHKVGSDHGNEIAKAFDDAVQASQRLRAYLGSARYSARIHSPMAEATALTQAACGALSALNTLVYEFERNTFEAHGEDAKKQAEQLRRDSYYAHQLLGTVNALQEFLSTPASQALVTRAYFLVGDAGTGKTHLLLDSVHRALEDHRPGAVLFGSQFGESNLWASIAEQLGLPPSGSDEILGALSACAEASSLEGRRFVVAIDALNETPKPSFWTHHLPALRAAISKWPYVAIVVSCRTTYLDSIDPDKRRDADYVTRSHPGFSGKEIDATHKYFLHYQLPEPQIPLLLPEFTVPLFLQLYCESLADGGAPPPDNHEGRVQIFNRFLDTKINRAATKLLPDVSSLERDEAKAEIRRVISLLLRECINSGREVIPRASLPTVGAAFVSGIGLGWMSVVGALEAEGVLTSDISYMDSERKPVLRITFQAFADFLILRERLGTLTRDQLLKDHAFPKWLAKASFGLLEAAAVVLPELYGIELPDYMKSRGRASNKRRVGWYEDLVSRTLPYRTSGSVSRRTIEILNTWLRVWDHGSNFFNVVFLLAPLIDHPLNANRLHEYLADMPMPQRDAWFGRATYYELSDGNSAAARLARWAEGGPYPSYKPEVVELASIPLVWLFSSPNRFNRDWITKALVQLLRGHPDVMLVLLRRFSSVNDPYVWERLVTAAYGSVMRADPILRVRFNEVVRFFITDVFAKLQRFTPDALMLDSARGIVEWGVATGVLTDDEAKIARPPYGFRAPAWPWTEKRIASRYESKAEQKKPVESTYATLYWSVLSLGDFGRYVVESGLRHFSRVRLSEPRPTRETAKTDSIRIDQRKWRRFTRSLSPSLIQMLTTADDSALASNVREAAAASFHNSLSDEQRQLLMESVVPRPHKSVRETSYPTGVAKRWIFKRVISLGWNPKLFGSFDRMLHYNDAGRSAHKAERFGKKYQWIAYHELLARIADNFHVDPFAWGSESFDGLYELNDREIDPSLPPPQFDLFVGRAEDTGTRTFVQHPVDLTLESVASPAFARYKLDAKAFLEDEGDVPTAEGLVRIRDSSNRSWIAVDGIFNAFDPESDDPGEYRGLEQWCHLHGWFVQLKDRRRAHRVLMDAARNQMSDVVDIHGHSDCCYIGELGWRPFNCYHRRLSPLPVEDPPRRDLLVYSTAESYSWSGSGFDCSINDGVSVTSPSAFVLVEGKLRWNADQPVWMRESEPVAAYVGTHGIHEKHALAFSEDWLGEFLRSKRLALVVTLHGERRRLAAEATYRESWLEFSSSVVLLGDGKFGLPTRQATLHPGGGSTTEPLARSRDALRVSVDDGESPRHPGGSSLRTGVLAYGSLIDDAGEIDAVTSDRIPARTPFRVEFARSSQSRDGAPTLVPVADGGAEVAAEILVLEEQVSLSAAADMLYRREINQAGSTTQYQRKSNPGPDDVVIKQLAPFDSVDVVLYTAIDRNIEPLTASELARLAIASARGASGSEKRDGISYLIACKRHEITTLLSDQYEAEILAQTGTSSLEDAWTACVESSASGASNGV